MKNLKKIKPSRQNGQGETKNNAHLECIRCGECKNVCPTDAISSSFQWVDKKDKVKEVKEA